MIVLTVANLKGGTGKTTTAAFVAQVLHELGYRVLCVDADPQGSLLRWQEVADLPVRAVAMPSSKLHRDLGEIVGDRFDVVIIDTPPLEHDRGIVVSAIRACTHLLIPLAPSPAEYDRLPATVGTLVDATELRPDGQTPEVAVLLTRTVANATSTSVYRSVIEEDGQRVLRVTVGSLQRYNQAYGQPIIRARSSAYGDVTAELLPELVDQGQEVTA